jgi:hypothetical protein
MHGQTSRRYTEHYEVQENVPDKLAGLRFIKR